jgi:acetolactate synthase-1/2/3 large subunit
MASCVETIAATLKGSGVKRIFGLPGGEILDLIEACRQVGIDFILTRHESTAAFVADVTGQITKRPGVCISTVGPGATNLVSGLANAYLDRSPLLALSAQLSSSFYTYSPHQRLDLAELFKPVTKWSSKISGKNTAVLIKKAIQISTTPRPGSVHISLPSDIAVKEELISLEEGECSKGKGESTELEGDVQEIADEIGKSQYPVVIVGIGADPRETQESIRRFIEKTGIPAMVTPKAKGIIPDDHPLFFGTAGGMAGDGLFLELLSQVDLVVGIGFDPVESDKIWHVEKKIISIDTASIKDDHYTPYMEKIGRVDRILNELNQMVTAKHRWTEKAVLSFRTKLDRAIKPRHRSSHKGLSPYHIAQTMREILPPDSIITVDVGAHKLLFGQIWKTYLPLTFFISNGLSSMGYGFPAAMAAKLEIPNKPVICVAGDGGFSMMIHDLETAVRLRLPVIVVVFSDGSLALIECVQAKRGLPSYGVSFKRVDFAKIAQGFGANGLKVSSFQEFEVALQEAIKAQGPTVIDVPIDPDEYRFQIQ